jgi:hypothetical protein
MIDPLAKVIKSGNPVNGAAPSKPEATFTPIVITEHRSWRL